MSNGSNHGAFTDPVHLFVGIIVHYSRCYSKVMRVEVCAKSLHGCQRHLKGLLNSGFPDQRMSMPSQNDVQIYVYKTG